MSSEMRALIEAGNKLLAAMEMQEGRESEALHIAQPTAKHLWDEAKTAWSRALIAELGQEVGAVGYDDGTGRVRDWASPAHTSEARDAALVDELVQASLALQMAKALTSLPLKYEFAKRNGMANHYEVEAWMLNAHRRFDAAIAAMQAKERQT